MNSLIIYVSFHHGNTEKIARAMADELEANLTTPEEVSTSRLMRFNLIGFGSGIYHGKHHKRLLTFVKTLPKVDEKKAFIFSTSGLRRIPLLHDFNKPLQKLLIKKGFKIRGSFSCRGYDTYGILKLLGGIHKGRPNQEDLANARGFVKDLISNN